MTLSVSNCSGPVSLKLQWPCLSVSNCSGPVRQSTAVAMSDSLKLQWPCQSPTAATLSVSVSNYSGPQHHPLISSSSSSITSNQTSPLWTSALRWPHHGPFLRTFITKVNENESEAGFRIDMGLLLMTKVMVGHEIQTKIGLHQKGNSISRF